MEIGTVTTMLYLRTYVPHMFAGFD